MTECADSKRMFGVLLCFYCHVVCCEKSEYNLSRASAKHNNIALCLTIVGGTNLAVQAPFSSQLYGKIDI